MARVRVNCGQFPGSRMFDGMIYKCSCQWIFIGASDEAISRMSTRQS